MSLDPTKMHHSKFLGCYNLKQPIYLGGLVLKVLLIFSLFIHSAVVYANLDCVAGDDPQLLTCDTAQEPELKPNGCQQQAINAGTENLEKISEQLNGQESAGKR